MTIHYRSSAAGPLRGELRVPGDKSISHRALMLGAISDGRTEIDGFLDGLDCLATRDALRAMGVRIEGPQEGRVRIDGVGLEGLQAAEQALDLGNSGTSMRLLAGLLAGMPFTSVLTGDSSLSRRPMHRVITPLTQMGARIEATADGTAPLQVHGRRPLAGLRYTLPVASAQVKSALLLAGLCAAGETLLVEPRPSRDHTERMLRARGADLRWLDAQRLVLRPGQSLTAAPVSVPGDISSAAFFIVAATLLPGSELLLREVGVNPTRTGLLEILKLMGANIELLDPREVAGEPVADLRVRHAPLHGIEIPPTLVPLAIDEFPILFLAAACAKGTTRLREAAELRVKESDRIEVMAQGLAALGIAVAPMPDGIIIEGGSLEGGQVDSHGDHRIAMTFSVAGALAHEPVIITDCGPIETSFPGFADCAGAVGLELELLPASALS